VAHTPLSEHHKLKVKHSTALFEKRLGLLSLWQEIANNFYPERADFIAERALGEDFAAHLDTSYPIIARRDLGNAFSSMLRPTEKEWFHVKADMDKEPEDARQWLEFATRTQRRAMYDRPARLIRATKEADHDFAAFGQCVLSSELVFQKKEGFHLLHRTWHLRDVAWSENAFGEIDHVYRKWKPTAREMKRLFKDRIHSDVEKACKDEPFKEFNCLHIVCPADDYEEMEGIGDWVSLYIDCDNQCVLEEKRTRNKIYIIARWQTVSGSQYAYSPAVVAALPDSRLIQAMTRTLLDAGNMATRPPLMATQEAIKSDLQYYEGGITWVDAQYDGQLDNAIRPILKDFKGIPIGMEMADSVRAVIDKAFYLNKLSPILPNKRPEMTAFEVGQVVQQYIRDALPLFEPMEVEYNGQLCDHDFDLLFWGGAFGPVEDIPQSLQGENLNFRFSSPLHDMIESVKPQKFREANVLLAEAAQLYPTAIRMLKAPEALRDALRGSQVPADWLHTEQEMAAIEQAEAQKAATQQLINQMSQGAQVAEQVGNAGIALKEAAAPAQVAA
jgi:hypothetical protein